MKSIIKIVLSIAIFSILITSCDEDEVKKFDPVGEIAIQMEGDLKVVPATVSFTVEAPNAAYYIWDFSYKKDLDAGDSDNTKLPMGAEGNEVELTFEHGGTYNVKVAAYNGNHEPKTKEINVVVYSVEDDLSISATKTMELDLQRDVCNPDNGLTFDVGYAINDDHSIILTAYVVREYNSSIYGNFSVTDTIQNNSIQYNYATQAELLNSFEIQGTDMNDADEVKYTLYVVANNEQTYKLDEAVGTVSVELQEPISLPLGNWEAKNESSGYTKTVELHRPSPFQSVDDGRYWISDFGLDWSNWRDYWYTIEFKLKCPEGDDPRYIIDLWGSGYDTGQDWTDVDHTGSTVTKQVRVMPYVYTSAAVGYYDPATQVITFENVPLTDNWWNADRHTVNLTFTFISN